MMADETPVLAGGWAAFVQPDGPGTQPIYLGCHGFDDIEQDQGDKTLIYCPDPNRANRWRVVGSYRGEPGPATTTITSNVKKTKDTLAGINCPIPVYLLQVSCGKRNVFTNWDSQAHVLYPADIVSKGLQNVAKKDPGDQAESMRTWDISADEWLEFYKPAVGRQSITETTALRDIVFCNDEKCADDCGQAAGPCESGALVSEANAGSPAGTADVWFTTDKGQTWTAGATDPFGTSEDIASIVCVQIDQSTTRYIVARGTTDAGNPAEIAYSDDSGATWTNVNVGSTVGQYALGPDSLFAIDANHIWLVTTGGYVYFSNDGGLTWTAQTSGTATAQNLYAISGAGEDTLYAVGVADAVIKTLDGGITWTLATATGSGDDLLTVDVRSSDVLSVGTDGGDIWRSTDGATTWEAQTFSGSGTGTVPDIQYIDDLCGWMLHNTAGPVGTIFRTINGGYNWEPFSTPTNVGLNAIYVCGPDMAYSVGEPSGGTGVVFRVA